MKLIRSICFVLALGSFSLVAQVKPPTKLSSTELESIRLKKIDQAKQALAGTSLGAKQAALQALQTLARASELALVRPFLSDPLLQGPASRCLQAMHVYAPEGVKAALLEALKKFPDSKDVRAALMQIRAPEILDQVAAEFPNQHPAMQALMMDYLAALNQAKAKALLQAGMAQAKGPLEKWRYQEVLNPKKIPGQPPLAAPSFLSSKAKNTALAQLWLRQEKAKGFPLVWQALGKGSLDGMELGPYVQAISVDPAIQAALNAFEGLSVDQKAVVLAYASSRQWAQAYALVWRYIQGNGPLRASAFAQLPHWAQAKDMPLLMEKLGTLSLASEVKILQDLIQKFSRSSNQWNEALHIEAAKAQHKEHYLPLVQEVQALAWVYPLAQSLRSEESIRTYVRLTERLKNSTHQVLNYRNALALCQSQSMKDEVLRRLSRCANFNAMRVLSEHLAESSQKAVLAEGLAQLFLQHPEWQGPASRDWCALALPHLQDAELRKQLQQALSNQLAKPGFYSLFNGQDLKGWKGLVDNPVKRRQMHPDTLAKKQVKADAQMRSGWYVSQGELHFSGKGQNLCTIKDYQDFELFVDWKIEKMGDAGIYLRGSPQVQIWDIANTKVGAQVGSGGLYNNQKNPSKPSQVADRPIGDWNQFYIRMQGERVSVWLNGEQVVDQVLLENFWDRKIPIFEKDAIELQAHGDHIVYRDIYVKELEPASPLALSEVDQKEGFKLLFDGKNLDAWTGNTQDYLPEHGNLALYPQRGGKGNLYTKEEFSDFHLKFEFQLSPGANNGLGIRTPMEGDAAYVGMELQILDNTAPVYAKLQPYQYHGSVYGIIPAKQGFLKPVGEWNQQEVIAQGNHIQVMLNGELILDGDLAEATKNGTADHKEHPGLFNKKGHIGFLGHGSALKFRNLRIKALAPEQESQKKKKRNK